MNSIKLQPTDITKELILSRVSEENLMEHYLGIPCKKGLFKSSLRIDKQPTCSFYRNKRNELIFKDFGSNFSGGFVNVVMERFKCSYYSALQIIANDFGIIQRPTLVKNKPKIEYTNSKFEETEQAIIQVQIRDWQKYELNWWSRYGITEKTLKKFKVFSAQNVWLNGNLFHTEKTNQHVFGYYGGIKDEIEQWRIYFPNRKHFKFISNWRQIQIQGTKQLIDGGDYLVITKSLKDVMVLYELGIPAIAPISENIFIGDSQYEKLKSKFKNIILFYDNDLAGLVNANKIRKKYPELHVFFIPRKYNIKDISDFYKANGRKKTLELIEEAKTYIGRKIAEREESS